MEIENKRSREFETIGPWKYSSRMRRMLEKDLWNGTIDCHLDERVKAGEMDARTSSKINKNDG